MKKTMATPALQAALMGAITLAAGMPAGASGFALPEVSAAGIGVANALVADPKERGALAYNPAAMGFHDRSSLSAGALFIHPVFSVETASGDHESEGASWIAAPMIQAAYVPDDRWRLGLSVNAPFGLETRWKLGTFPRLSQPIPIGPGVALPAGLDHPTQSKLEVIAASPAISFRVNENLSIAAGADYYHALDATLNTHVSKLNGDGDAWGWNLSALYRIGPLSLGAAYRSGATIDIDGTVEVFDPVLVALGAPPSQEATVDLDLPWRLQLGARYQLLPELAVEIDWTRTEWTAFDELVVEGVSGADIRRDANRWHDANAYRLGVTYDIRPGTRLRFGYAYDETGQDDEYFGGRVPDNDRHLFGFGVGQDLGRGWTLDAGYMYVRFEEREYRGDRPYVPGQDINGTNAIDGDYQASAHLIGLELGKVF